MSAPGLIHLLLLGAPDGKTERIDGAVRRVWDGHSADRARAVFEAIAKEIREYHGLGGRDAMVNEKATFASGDMSLEIDGTVVTLDVCVPIEIWRTFSG